MLRNVHFRRLTGGILCAGVNGAPRQSVISSSQRERVSCAECLFRLDGGGDKAGVSADPSEERSPAAAMSM